MGFRFVVGVALDNTKPTQRSASVLSPADVRYECRVQQLEAVRRQEISIDNAAMNHMSPARDKLSVVRVEAVELGRAEGHRGTEKEAKTGTSAGPTGNCGDRCIHLRRSNASKGVPRGVSDEGHR